MTAGQAVQLLHPDRLLPADPGEHNDPFHDPATLLVTADHDVTRLLHASGVELGALGVGQGSLSEDAARAAWRLLCQRWHLLEMARMSCDDGLVMALHPGVRRNHHRPTLDRFGPDTGHDIPKRVEFTDALRPLLERFGTHPGFHLVAFTVDETVWSRELAPLAGFYPSVYVGVPWWFLDAPDAIRRFFAAVTETAADLMTVQPTAVFRL